MDYNLVINRLKQFYDYKTDKQLCDKLGITSSNLGTWRQRNTINADCIFANCQEVDYNWLFKGEIQQNEKLDSFAEPAAQYPTFNNSSAELLQFYKVEYERKCRELEEANARVDKLIDKIGCAVSQNNVKGNNFNN